MTFIEHFNREIFEHYLGIGYDFDFIVGEIDLIGSYLKGIEAMTMNTDACVLIDIMKKIILLIEILFHVIKSFLFIFKNAKYSYFPSLQSSNNSTITQ